MDFQTRYEFNPKTDLLGKGGFSKVYKARDTLLERTVALKLFMADASEKYQILSEIKKVIQFEHPNLCKYYDVAVLNSKNIFGEVQQTEVGIMEYLDAGDLKTYLNYNPQFADKLLIDVLRGLSYLHKKGIVHRDLKPQNILVKIVDDEPIAKITDFGISKLISSEDNNSSALIGTIEYMAPEQFNPKKYGIGGRITTNLDLWSFGLLVYEIVFHKSLFGRRSTGTSAEQVMRNILSESWLTKINSLPLKYQEIVKRCLVKNASDRVQNASELIPLFSEPAIPAEKIIVEKKEEPEAISLIHDSKTNQIEEEDENGDTQVVEPVDHSTGADLQVDHPVDEGAKEPIADIQPVTEELNNNDTEVINQEPDLTMAETELHSFEEEPTSENTELIQPGEDDIYNNETQLVPLEETMRGEYAEVLHFKQEVPLDSTIQNTSPGEKQLSATLNKSANDRLIQSDSPQKETVTSKTNRGNKIGLYALASVIIIAVFFLARFLSEDKPKVIENTIHQSDIVPPPEQSSFIALPQLIQVDGGKFLMGSKNSEATASELPAHLVNLNDFSIGKYEVTVDEFRSFVGESKYTTTAEEEGSSDIYKNGDWQTGKSVNWRHDISGNLLDTSLKNIPVVHVSWTDVNKYCEWLSTKTNTRYRLPTEAEWEFAARGGTLTKNFPYSGSNKIEDVAWCLTNSGEKTHPVGQKKPNELGIYDMNGNVMEWCYDWYEEDYYKKSGMNNPGGPTTGKVRAVRGGSWFLEDKTWFRNSFRAGFPPDVRGGQLGFRICRTNDSNNPVK